MQDFYCMGQSRCVEMLHFILCLDTDFIEPKTKYISGE